MADRALLGALPGKNTIVVFMIILLSPTPLKRKHARVRSPLRAFFFYNNSRAYKCPAGICDER